MFCNLFVFIICYCLLYFGFKNLISFLYYILKYIKKFKGIIFIRFFFFCVCVYDLNLILESRLIFFFYFCIFKNYHYRLYTLNYFKMLMYNDNSFEFFLLLICYKKKKFNENSIVII